MALVTQPIEHIEEIEVIGLADVGLVAVGVARDLDVRGDGEQPLGTPGQVTLGDLAVIEVELQLEMRRADLAHDLLDLRGGVGEVAGNVAMVDRLQHDGDAVLGRAVANLLQVRHEGPVHRPGVAAGRDQPGHDV